jgi:hypothetical protein
MPLYNTLTVNPSTKAYLWQVTESEDELSEGIALTPHCQNRMDGMKSELHRRAFLSKPVMSIRTCFTMRPENRT